MGGWQRFLLHAFLVGLGSGAGLVSACRATLWGQGSQRVPQDSALQPGDSPAETLPAWTGATRVTVLLLGLDAREGDPDPPRTDTIILASLDSEERRAVLVSIPRDLWVAIPGYGYERINAAWPLGEAARQRSPSMTGATLLRRTIEANFGIPVDYFVAVDFQGFISAIDALGGVLVDVERPLKDNEYPSFQYPHYERIYIPAGLQLMNGATALRYVRSRHQDSDFGRQRRQQQVLLAARERLLRLSSLPRLPQLLRVLHATVRTDIPLVDMLALARLALEVTPDRVATRVIDESFTTRWITPSGADVLLPKWPEVQRMLADVWGTSSPGAPAPAQVPTVALAPRAGTTSRPRAAARSRPGSASVSSGP